MNKGSRNVGKRVKPRDPEMVPPVILLGALIFTREEINGEVLKGYGFTLPKMVTHVLTKGKSKTKDYRFINVEITPPRRIS